MTILPKNWIFHSPIKATFFFFLLCVPIFKGSASAQQVNNPVPSGFNLIASGTGVRVYKKDYPGCPPPSCYPDYVTVVDLRSATVRNLTGAVAGDRVGWENQTEFWKQAERGNTGSRRVLVVVNGTFFDPNHEPSGIAFGLKRDNQLISYGYEQGNDRMHLVWRGGGSVLAVQPWNQAVFDSQNLPNVVGGLIENTSRRDVRCGTYTKRTAVGTRETDGDRLNDTMLIYTSEKAFCSDAASILRSFGVNGVMLLDGGGSTFLTINGTNTISTSRRVPHALAVYSGQ
jgi:hypothetical protein